jgi:S-DNA-T family DNA segregation ATPase FtsK/SpoIIIE
LAKRKKKSTGTDKNYTGEVIAIILLAIAFIFTLSLISYHPLDETVLSAATENHKTANYIGPLGANVSILFYQILGYSAFVIPAALFALSGSLLLRIRMRSPLSKMFGLILLILGLSTVLHFFIPQFNMLDTEHAFSGGGVLAGLLTSLMKPAIGEIGIIIVAYTLIGISLLLTFQFSFAAMFRNAGVFFSKFQSKLKNRHKSPGAIKREAKRANEPKIVVKVNLSLPWRKRKQLQEARIEEIEIIRDSQEDQTVPDVELVDVPQNGEIVPEDFPLPHIMEADEFIIEEDKENPPVAIIDEKLDGLELSKPVEKTKTTSDDRPASPKPKPLAVTKPKKTIKVENLSGMQAPVNILDDLEDHNNPLNLRMLAEQSRIIVDCYKEFGVEGQVLQTNPGPVVNTFEFKPAPGVKYNKVVNLENELCLALKAISIRINRIAGKSTIGIEVPNNQRQIIYFRELLESPQYQNSKSPLTMCMGKTIDGDPYISCLDEMPHLLIGGATGTGKSVALNAMICSVLFKSPPEITKFIMIDPKHVELSLYEGIPHLLTPVVSHPKKAATALRWACEEMEIRYRNLARMSVRNIAQYNKAVAKMDSQPQLNIDGEAAAKPPEIMPYIVVVIDELADLMMVASSDVEESICRLAQKARAVGIHLIVATQRPSVDVLTGVIKANFPCRISFEVFSKVDSRVILDSYGAENLLGKGDMLFMPPRSSMLQRLHGSLINEEESKRLVGYLRRMDEPVYDENIIAMQEAEEATVNGISADLAPDKDPLFDDAVNLVVTTGVASISNLQRKMRLGYARAARIIDMMEQEGIIGPADGSKPREILKRPSETGEPPMSQVN